MTTAQVTFADGKIWVTVVGRALPERIYGGSSLNTVSLPWEAWLEPAYCRSRHNEHRAVDDNRSCEGPRRGKRCRARPLACPRAAAPRPAPSRAPATRRRRRGSFRPGRRRHASPAAESPDRASTCSSGSSMSTPPKSSGPLRRRSPRACPRARPRRGCPSRAAAAPPRSSCPRQGHRRSGGRASRPSCRRRRRGSCRRRRRRRGHHRPWEAAPPRSSFRASTS